MDNRILVSLQNGLKFFHFEKLSVTSSLRDFCCSISEYDEYLACEAVRSRKDHIALTWLLRDACSCDEVYAACRFLTVDADIEHNASVLNFYKKNGFLVNEELYNRNRKTISMRKDIYS
jgi:hypothetical protein